MRMLLGNPMQRGGPARPNVQRQAPAGMTGLTPLGGGVQPTTFGQTPGATITAPDGQTHAYNPALGMVSAADFTPGAVQRSAGGRQTNGRVPAGGGGPRAMPAAPANGAALSPFGEGNNLIGQQISPANSAYTNWLQNQSQTAGNAYSGFQFTPYQGLAPVDFTAERGMLTGANNAAQGLGYDFSGANSQYTGALGQQMGARNTATGSLQGLQALGTGAFSGGGANTASTAGLDAALAQARDTIGGQFNYGADIGKARGMVLPALEAAMTGPERGQIAAESLALLEERSRPGYDRDLRSVTERNAAMGRRGSGLTTNELTDVTSARERELALARRDLANEAAARTLQDRTDRTNLAMGVTTGLGNEDRSAAMVRLAQAEGLSALGKTGFDALAFNAGQQESASKRAAQGAQFGADFQRGVATDLYGMGKDSASLMFDVGDRYRDQARDRVDLGLEQARFGRDTANDLAGLTKDTWESRRLERDAARKDEYAQGDWRRNMFSDFSDATRNGWSEDRSRRNEMRDERDWQYGLSRDAIGDSYAQQAWEEALRGNRYNRGLGYAGLGFGGADAVGDAYGNAAAQGNANAAAGYGGMADILSQLMAQYGNRGGGRRGGAGAGRAPGLQAYDVNALA